jgi:WD40 repeat protein
MKTSNIIVTAQSDGMLRHWHVTTGKCIHQMEVAEDNDLFSVDYSPDGQHLAVAGKDHQIRVFDEMSKVVDFKFEGL